MNTNNYKIIKLDKEYISSVELIWRESLPDNLKSMIGSKIIKNYLEKFLMDNSNLGTGIMDTNKLVGFVLFGQDSQIVKRLIKEDFFIIFKSFIQSILFFKIKKIVNFLNCIIYILISNRKEIALHSENTELLIICVSKKFQNKGFGSFLIKESFKNYSTFFKKFKGIFVKTLKKDNNNVFFYKKNRFKYVFEIFGRVYLKY